MIRMEERNVDMERKGCWAPLILSYFTIYKSQNCTPIVAIVNEGLTSGYSVGASVCSTPILSNLLPLIGPHQSEGSCSLWELGLLTLNMWFSGSGHRHLLTHSVEIRHCLQLGISETIVTNKKLVAEWKLCILSQRSCRNITIPDKFLCRILAAWMGAPSFHANTLTHTRLHTFVANQAL